MLILASRAFRSYTLQASCSPAYLQSTSASAPLSDGIESIIPGQLQQQRWMAVPKRKVLIPVTATFLKSPWAPNEAYEKTGSHVEDHATSNSSLPCADITTPERNAKCKQISEAH